MSAQLQRLVLIFSREGLSSALEALEGVLFSTEGSTGWHRRRDLADYKGNKSQKNFDHLNEKFWGEGDDPV